MLSSREMSTPITLNTPVNELHLHGIARLGQKTSAKLAQALSGTATRKTAAEVNVEDLLGYLPMRYEDRSNLARISDLQEGMEASLELYVKLAGGYQVRNKRSFRQRLFIFEISATDLERTGRPVVVWTFLSGPHAQQIVTNYTRRFERGVRFVAFGKWEWDPRRATFALRLNKPDEIEVLPVVSGNQEVAAATANGDSTDSIAQDFQSDPALAAIHVGRRVPVYRKLGELRPKHLREIIHATLHSLPEDSFAETLPADLRRRLALVDRSKAFHQIHFPPETASLDQYEEARSPAHLRLIFEDFFWLAFGLLLKRGQRRKEAKGAAIKIDQAMKLRIGSVLPFKLTAAQRRVVVEIFKDMQSDAPMNRLLQGDVGSGKTIVALIAMLAAMENGYQTALMAPTEILAEQHARNIKRLLAKTPFRVELLTGSVRSAEKRRLHADLATGEIHACIGTQALIQEAVSFQKLGLVIIDEQHRFGVVQRAELRARGLNPDVLVMTATPIPRSLAMTVYGDLDVSIIDELPPGRTPVETLVFGDNPDDRKEVKKVIDRELRAGRQIYVVYPLVEESEKIDLKDATQRYEYLRDKVFPGLSIGLVHGRLKPADKEDVMRRFVTGEIRILVSTTVIEVGVDVPNASVMIVEHAERFGLSQLHQLRGRVGRGAEKSYCLLLSSEKRTSVAEERLGIMEKTTDGFIIAEKDMELRGAGELLGTRQSGLPEFRVGNLFRDMQILELARKEAELYLSKREKSVDTKRMIQRVREDPRFGLAAVG
ncbi:MAG: ATP-dependent helicase RecG [Acidobacteria bacterium]|nr:ATP-dependent helicase RecG [Acidobacteriota bacterium]